MTTSDSPVSDLQAALKRFLALVADVRPDLHRYCARMTGSVTDGEDIVQETLVRAYYALSEVETMPPLRQWLFQIAHHRAVDYLRGYERRRGQPLDEIVAGTVADDAEPADDALARDAVLRAALSRFLELPPAQRSCVILKDVLDHSVEEIAAMLDLTVPAVRSALYRGRATLRAQSSTLSREIAGGAARQASPTIARYAALFNARDWDGVRAMLAEDVRLDLVSRLQRSGRREVSGYFKNYESIRDWRVAPAWLDGHEVLAVFRGANNDRPAYFIEVTAQEDRITVIRDYRYIEYIARDAEIELANSS